MRAAPNARDWWLVVTSTGVDLCDFDPGYEPTVRATSTLRDMVLLWRGDVSWTTALRTGTLRLTGQAHARRGLPHWMRMSRYARSPNRTARPAGASV